MMTRDSALVVFLLALMAWAGACTVVQVPSHEQIEADLTSGEAAVRAEALRLLIMSRPENLVERLFTALEDPAGEVRVAAYDGLGVHGKSADGARVLERAQTEAQPEALAEAIRALGMLKCRDARDFCRAGLDHREVPVRLAALQAVALLAGEGAYEAILPFLERDDRALRLASVAALAILDDARALEVVRARFSADAPGTLDDIDLALLSVEVETLWSLSESARQREERERSDDFEITRRLADADPATRALALKEVGERSLHLPAMLDRFHDDLVFLRLFAASAAQVSRTREAASACATLLGEFHPRSLSPKDNHTLAWQTVAAAYAELESAERAEAFFTTTFADENPIVRALSAWYLPERDLPRIRACFFELLGHEDAATRVEIARVIALAWAKDDDTEARAALIDAHARESDADVKRRLSDLIASWPP